MQFRTFDTPQNLAQFDQWAHGRWFGKVADEFNSLRSNPSINALRYMTDAQAADVQAYLYTQDVTIPVRTAAADAHATGRPLYFPAGGYRVSDINYGGGQTPDVYGFLYLSGQPIRIYGDGPKSTIFKVYGTISRGFVIATVAGHTSVEGIGFDMNGSTGSAVVVQSQSTTVGNLHIQNVGPGGWAVDVDAATLSTLHTITTAACANGIRLAASADTNYIMLYGMRLATCTEGYVIKIGYTGAPLGRAAHITFIGTYFEDAPLAAILIEKAVSVQFISYAGELTADTTLTGTAYIKTSASRDVHFSNGYVNHYGEPDDKAVYEWDDVDGYSVTKTYVRTELDDMAFFRASGSASYNVTIEDIIDNTTPAHLGVDCTATGFNLRVGNYAETSTNATHVFDATRLRVDNLLGAYSVTTRDDQTFINCPGARTGTGANTITLIPEPIETISASGALSVRGISKLNAASGVQADTLADGGLIGADKLIVMTNATNNAVVTVAHHEGSLDVAFTFNAVNDTLILRWQGTYYVTIKSVGI